MFAVVVVLHLTWHMRGIRRVLVDVDNRRAHEMMLF